MDVLGETLGIKVEPSEVRLKNEDDLGYTWQIYDLSLEPIFQKSLSKHSENEKDRGVDFISKLLAENLDLAEKLRRVQDEASRHENAALEGEEEIRDQKSVIREAQMTVHLQQQDILKWMATSEWYRARCLKVSDSFTSYFGIFARESV
ncbi:uncharacterized protein N7484_002915 [Penicillium longicatenatum]|uniref:uncharacterized protein n=1 Tax=Penicillium longicatenatum TaxID=1561947 RepID=UPI0025490ACC|nr:uncharacterized protein N7484_002915 [Penicillium longicatenatum]KAJ5649192.1 hypothetical protein N7484_002915 [Penicillium longicatenatum]